MTRYIYDGKLYESLEEPPVLFVVDETNTHGTGRTDTALQFASQVTQLRKTEAQPLIIGHELERRGDR